MKTIFKKGDTVFDYQYGWGKIMKINKHMKSLYVQYVQYENEIIIGYNDNGSLESKQALRLSFTEYNFVTGGFSQERPTLFCQAINKVKKVINKKLKK